MCANLEAWIEVRQNSEHRLEYCSRCLLMKICAHGYLSVWPTPNSVVVGDLAAAGRHLAPLLVSSRNLCHAAALNFITPPYDTDDDSKPEGLVESHTGKLLLCCKGFQTPPDILNRSSAVFFFFFFLFFLSSSPTIHISAWGSISLNWGKLKKLKAIWWASCVNDDIEKRGKTQRYVT